MRSALAALLLFAFVGCTPMTFSNDAPIDFRRYSLVGVNVFVNARFERVESAYLVEELREDSGFQRLQVGIDSDVDAELIIEVEVWDEPADDEDDWDGVYYESRADFYLYDRDGNLVDTGSTDAQSEFEREAVEDALDLVSLHYFRDYRI